MPSNTLWSVPRATASAHPRAGRRDLRPVLPLHHPAAVQLDLPEGRAAGY